MKKRGNKRRKGGKKEGKDRKLGKKEGNKGEIRGEKEVKRENMTCLYGFLVE